MKERNPYAKEILYPLKAGAEATGVFFSQIAKNIATQERKEIALLKIRDCLNRRYENSHPFWTELLLQMIFSK